MRRPLPLVFHIHRFALDDGPGIRTTVFLKGCPLSCSWCHNPEAMRAEPDLAFYPDRCIGCGSCQAVCQQEAISNTSGLQIDRGRCTLCGSCAASCPAMAIELLGKAYQLDHLVEIVLRDRLFFEASGGGVTFSGGEPTGWPEFLGAALGRLKSAGLHTAIETCGMFDYRTFSRQVLPFVDLIMFDLKFIDGAEHRKYTGRDNRVVLENFKRLTREAGSRVLPRVPLVPGMTATPGNLSAIASLLAGLGYSRCDLLPYHPAGIEKRRAIGMQLPPTLAASPLSRGEEQRLRAFFSQQFSQQLGIAA